MSGQLARVTVCGGGNGAHAFAGLASHRGLSVKVLSLFGDEAKRWKDALKDDKFVVVGDTLEGEIEMSGKLGVITNDHKLALADADIVIFIVPSFSHNLYLNTLKPYIRKDLVVIGMPGGAGFDVEAKSVLGEKFNDVILGSAESLPWACRILEFGRKVLVGYKNQLNVVFNKDLPFDVLGALQNILGDRPKLTLDKGHMLGMTLTNPNAQVHPTFSYFRWKDWDGKPIQKVPLVYKEATKEMVDYVEKVNSEVKQIAQKIEKSHDIDLSNVRSLVDFWVRCYGYEIETKYQGCFFSAITHSPPHSTMRFPMRSTELGYLPDFKNRFFSEDIPMGLCVVKGLADLAGVATPHIDSIISWAQSHMNKEYIVNGKLEGKDVKDTRAPQRYGFDSLETLLSH